MASFFRIFSRSGVELPRIIFGLVTLLIVTPVHAAGGFADASERTAMCAATAGTISESNSDEHCPNPITTKDGREFCPQRKPSAVCTKLLSEAEPVCDLDSTGENHCEILTPGQAVSKALEEQLEDAE
jgi:hypothetical protein